MNTVIVPVNGTGLEFRRVIEALNPGVIFEFREYTDKGKRELIDTLEVK